MRQGRTAVVSNQHLFLNVPARNHDALHTSNQSVRVVQPVRDQNFDVSIKIDSPVVATDVGTSQGLMVLADNENFYDLRAGHERNQSRPQRSNRNRWDCGYSLEEASFNEYQNPMCLRITRNGVAYIAYYSVDGVVWTQAASFTDAGFRL